MTVRVSTSDGLDSPHLVTEPAALQKRRAAVATSFSILFEGEADVALANDQPGFFLDLNIDQIVSGIVAGRDEYDLARFFNSTLKRAEAIRYRYDVFRDCRRPEISGFLRAFADRMRFVRQHLAQIDKLSEKLQKQAWLVDAIDLYCVGCEELLGALCSSKPMSDGFKRLVEYLGEYTASSPFVTMKDGAAGLKRDLGALRYKVIVEAGSFTVQRYEGEIDYSADVLETFQRFKQTTAKDHHSGKFHEWPDMNHIEAKILEFVSLLFPETFARLNTFCEAHTTFRDPAIERFDREVQFYAGYLEYIRPLTGKGEPFCYADVSNSEKSVRGDDGFDLALAVKLAKDEKNVVRNSFSLSRDERILVVSGPNQGGKTTFARMFGQMHYLAAIGCPVPGTAAHLHLFDAMFTHFEREETIETLSGKLQDDLNRIHDILAAASTDSIVILNEIFTSTSLEDALFLSKQIISRILHLDMLAVWVTFVDELSLLGPATVSMVSDIVKEDPTQRTFRILRKPADGKSYAMSLALKHGLTYERIVERVGA